ncbi:MAG: DUF2065 domain-containing protein [Gammaproteobacteria bacterium]|nr:DUF2065 domain-containing protein [Gammaproteobacteria bacterium]
MNETLLGSLFIATALMLVIEGIMPFINPVMFRRSLIQLIGMSDQTLRIIGLLSMCFGLGLLYWAH